MKILCLGNNTEDTDHKTKRLCDTVCYGLLSELSGNLSVNDYARDGWYHSSVYDIEFGRLLEISKSFDRVIMLDQDINEWSHPDAFYNTVRLMKLLDSKAQFLDSNYRAGVDYFENLVKENPSFCIFPFIELLVNYDHTTVCCRSSTPVTKLTDLTDYYHDKGYQKIRQKMLSGELIPEHCKHCYDLESKGIPSARQQETVEWANRLGLKNIEQLKKISKPVYYEVRANNKCNLQCRMCNPENSHLIDKEYRKIGIISSKPNVQKKHATGFEIIDFENLKKLYIAGGEPTVMTEMYDFLDQCIATKNTHHEILINTNGTKLSDKFKKQLKHFTNLQFIFSIDGFEDINHYIRWPSDWKHIIENWKYLRDRGHKITVNTTASIYNIDSLSALFDFIDNNFPGTLIHIQLAESYLSPFHHPDRTLVIEDLEKIQKLSCYSNDLLFSKTIDGFLDLFRKIQKQKSLQKFFEFNDQLDHSRGVKLADYIPSLEKFRS